MKERLPKLFTLLPAMKNFIVIAWMLLLFACNQTDTLFVKQASSHTGIHFNNKIVENDSINPLDLEFVYNGGGVAVGDFNNDGLPDLYFTASTEKNRLYLNEGNFKFKDITDIAKVDGQG
ncbi:MAG: FG-GAP repeat domain-containing protein [Ilyomonas sp.]